MKCRERIQIRIDSEGEKPSLEIYLRRAQKSNDISSERSDCKILSLPNDHRSKVELLSSGNKSEISSFGTDIY